MPEDSKVTHLQMIQGVVNRMGANSFSLKTLAVSFAGAAVAYFGAVPHTSKVLFIGVGFGIAIFWILDAQYLRLERLFRELYAKIRNQTSSDYSMDTREFQSSVASTMRIGFSWSVVWLYLFLICALVIVAYSR